MAKPKRPALLDSINMEIGQGATPAKIVDIKPKAAPVKEKQTTVKTSLYLPQQAHRLLKEIAFAQDCKVHDLVIDGVNQVLAAKGYGTVSELSKK